MRSWPEKLTTSIHHLLHKQANALEGVYGSLFSEGSSLPAGTRDPRPRRFELYRDVGWGVPVGFWLLGTLLGTTGGTSTRLDIRAYC